MTKMPIVSLALPLAVLFSLPACAGPEEPQSTPLPGLAVLLDLSASSPITVSDEYAATVAQDVQSTFEDLTEHSRILFRTFGVYQVADQANNALHMEARISRNYRPPTAAAELSGLIAAVPARVRSGGIDVQGDTNVVAAMTDLARRIDCTEEEVFDVVLVSDGIESSDAYGAEIVSPNRPIFEGCGTLNIVGLTGTSPSHTEQLVEDWTRYGRDAGFRDVRILR